MPERYTFKQDGISSWEIRSQPSLGLVASGAGAYALLGEAWCQMLNASSNIERPETIEEFRERTAKGKR